MAIYVYDNMVERNFWLVLLSYGIPARMKSLVIGTHLNTAVPAVVAVRRTSSYPESRFNTGFVL